ncbi:MAG: hypothetical protein ACI8QS_003228 [Planctomycetota bacterium]|jgi:protocatechuate 3,4-dioxygenase beta subunit
MKRVVLPALLLVAALLALIFLNAEDDLVGDIAQAEPSEVEVPEDTPADELVDPEANQARVVAPAVEDAQSEPTTEQELEAVAEEEPEAELALRVQVLDVDGKPAIGVEVGYRIQPRDAQDSGNDLDQAITTAPDGIAILDREKEKRVMDYFEGMHQPFERVVTCRGAFIDPASEVVEESAIEDVVVLEMNPTGAVDVEVRGPDGELIIDGVAVQLSWTFPGEEQRDSFEWLKVEGGLASYEHLSCGMRLDVGGSVRGSFFKGVRQELPGPRKQGERVSVVLRFEEEHPVLSGRLLMPDGTPCADFTFGLEIEYTGPPKRPRDAFRWRGSFHETDASGDFSIAWSMANWTREGASGVRRLRFTENASSSEELGRAPTFTTVLAPLFVEGQTRYELGEFGLEPSPLAVAGQIVDAEGEPARHVYVSLQYAVEEGGTLKWYNYNSRPRTRDDGRFEIYSHLPFQRLRVSGRKNRGGATEALDIQMGADDVRLVFLEDDDESTKGTVLGTVLADAEIPFSGLEVRMRSVGEERNWRTGSSTVFSGAFHISRVLPGTYLLELVADGHGFSGPDFVLFEEQGVFVRSGEETVVSPIDLRGKLRLFELKILDAEGERVDRVSCVVATRLGRSRGAWVYGGRLAFIAPATVDSAQISVGGGELFTVTWTPEPQTIRL